MAQKTVFQSNISFQDAAQKAQAAGYTPTGQAMNKAGWFIVFAIRNEQPQQRSVFNADWLKGKI